ncbi:hypothetical protein UFOVP204_30 [uncultured Caudovirales phage]|uniref:Uncharacterized protein n=1 Tax=uncultured Caudovirales phage TaxID=2100421 RepID=A0A6J7WMW8_9CAUD|nr:hypothetical protein UFOVP204_30 [uncultured Caudovirales phage]
MTTDYSYVAAYDVRNALWQEIEENGLLDINDYYADGFSEPLLPIIPAQQVPEFNNLLPGKTYIIYDIMQKNYGVQWWMSQETITFEITSTSAAEIQTLNNLISDMFRRYDSSAKDINLKLNPESPYNFHYFRLVSADPVQSFQTEGGLMMGVISLDYSYSRDLDPVTGRYL